MTSGPEAPDACKSSSPSPSRIQHSGVETTSSGPSNQTPVRRAESENPSGMESVQEIEQRESWSATASAYRAGVGLVLLTLALSSGWKQWLVRPKTHPTIQELSFLLDLNQATAAQLQALPEIGPALATRIVEQREQAGPFRRVEDLLQVRGMGPATLEKIESLLVVDAGAELESELMRRSVSLAKEQ